MALRAQLLEEGFEMAADDRWPVPAVYSPPGRQPGLLLIDLHRFAETTRLLQEAARVVPTDRLLVLTALDTVRPADLSAEGLQALARPIAVGDVVSDAAAILRRRPRDAPQRASSNVAGSATRSTTSRRKPTASSPSTTRWS